MHFGASNHVFPWLLIRNAQLWPSSYPQISPAFALTLFMADGDPLHAGADDHNSTGWPGLLGACRRVPRKAQLRSSSQPLCKSCSEQHRQATAHMVLDSAHTASATWKTAANHVHTVHFAHKLPRMAGSPQTLSQRCGMLQRGGTGHRKTQATRDWLSDYPRHLPQPAAPVVDAVAGGWHDLAGWCVAPGDVDRGAQQGLEGAALTLVPTPQPTLRVCSNSSNSKDETFVANSNEKKFVYIS